MIQDLINKYIKDPKSFDTNIDLANLYEAIGQLASSSTHYLKAADLAGIDKIKMYTAISGLARCFEKAGGREATLEGLLKRAITYNPTEAKAYVPLCYLYEHKRQWYDCYMLASIGLQNSKEFDFVLFFLKGVSAWWIGNVEESREIIYCLWTQRYKIKDEEFRKLLVQNLYNVGDPYAHNRYYKSKYPALKRHFDGIENIEHNYSQCHQDMYALLASEGKRDGFYLEIGSGDPEHNNNTCLLERDFGWKGISIDIDFSVTQRFRAIRENTCVQTDATKVDYKELLESYNAPKTIDYLQIDVDPPQNLSLDVLYRIPFEDYKFRAVTFEHNGFESPEVRELSRAYLKSKNYRMVVSDVAFRGLNSFEDWWVHNSVPFAYANVDLSATPKTPQSYFYEKTKYDELYLSEYHNWVNLPEV